MLFFARLNWFSENIALENFEKANFGENVYKNFFWQYWVLLKVLSLKSLKKQTLLILWAARLGETYPKSPFDKISGFWKL